METLSLIGILVGLVVMVALVYKGYSVIWAAPLAAFIVCLFSLGAGLGEGKNLLTMYTEDYMQGVGAYFISWFPTFLLGAIFGKAMDMTGAAQSLADVIVKHIGPRFAVLAVLIPCMALTYGGVSLFVVVFIIYPMGYSIFKAANLPKTLLPAIITFGIIGITMTSIPGTPQIQNLIPMQYFGTTATAAPVLGIVSSVLVFVPGYIYLNSRVKKARAAGLTFTEDSLFVTGDVSGEVKPKWHFLSGIIPLVVVFVCLNILKMNIVIALILGILVCFAMNPGKIRKLPSALTEGAKGSVTAIMNTACAVGFGSIIRVVPGFVLLTALLVGEGSSALSLLFSEAMSTAVLAGATGSASGGLSIALAAFGDSYLNMAGPLGISPEILHRVASIAAGSLDKLPHNGALVTLLTISHCSHKETYKDIFISSVVIPMIVLIVIVVALGIIL